MLAAVAEAQRVLRPTGRLLDIHPDPAPRWLEVWHPTTAVEDDDFDPAHFARLRLGSLTPYDALQDFAEANRALAAAASLGLSPAHRHAFDYHSFFESLDALTTYLEDTEELQYTGDDLLEKALFAPQNTPPRAWLVLGQKVWVTVLVPGYRNG
jgi:hypothetical protein